MYSKISATKQILLFFTNGTTKNALFNVMYFNFCSYCFKVSKAEVPFPVNSFFSLNDKEDKYLILEIIMKALMGTPRPAILSRTL